MYTVKTNDLSDSWKILQSPHLYHLWWREFQNQEKYNQYITVLENVYMTSFKVKIELPMQKKQSWSFYFKEDSNTIDVVQTSLSQSRWEKLIDVNFDHKKSLSHLLKDLSYALRELKNL